MPDEVQDRPEQKAGGGDGVEVIDLEEGPRDADFDADFNAEADLDEEEEEGY